MKLSVPEKERLSSFFLAHHKFYFYLFPSQEPFQEPGKEKEDQLHILFPCPWLKTDLSPEEILKHSAFILRNQTTIDISFYQENLKRAKCYLPTDHPLLSTAGLFMTIHAVCFLLGKKEIKFEDFLLDEENQIYFSSYCLMNGGERLPIEDYNYYTNEGLIQLREAIFNRNQKENFRPLPFWRKIGAIDLILFRLYFP